MRQTMLIGMVLGLLWLAVGYFQPARAYGPLVNTNALKKIQLIPSNTPTPTVQPTLSPKISPTVTPTMAEATVTPTENPLMTATVTSLPTTTPAQTGNNMTFWFLLVTIGLLAVIIIVQAWPRKNEEE